MSQLNERSEKIGVAPKIHHDVYEAISPTRFVGSMADKVVFVTGAGRGIGKAIALAFAEAGADLAILARTKSQLDEVAESIKSKFGRKCLVFAVDATDAVAVQAAVNETELTLGPPDVVIPNAAAPLMLARMVLDSMQKRDSGSIIIISSKAGVVNVAGGSVYCVSKTALIRAAACLQLELDAIKKSGVHIYSVHPGGVKTDMARETPHPDVEKMKPGFTERINKFRDSFLDTPELCAWTCVYLATGRASDTLRGRYVDVEYDIEDIVKQGDVVQKEGLYDLTVKTLGDV